MKIAYATTFSAEDVNNWSGTPFYMSRAFNDAGCDIQYIGNLKRKLPPFFKIKQAYKQWMAAQRESPRFNITAARFYSEQAAAALRSSNADVVISPQINPVAYLDCKQPIVLWTDALYASLVGFYPAFNHHSASSIQQGNHITQECLSRCELALFSSDWAARGAMELYGTAKEKIKVVPFGANLQEAPSLEDVRNMVQRRPRDKIKLLFLGKHWGRKGGDIVFRVAKALHAAGQAVELHFVGCQPPATEDIPSYIHCHGFISKRTPHGIAKIRALLSECHFLFVPSRAEAYGIVFCEANAFGLPCLTSYVGGISTIVKDDINGKTFALDAPAEIYCQYIMNIMQQESRYNEMALASYHEFETRLNWKTSVETVKKLIRS